MLSVTTANVFPKRLAALVEEHNDLDDAVAVLLSSATCDDLLVSRLKKRKLQLKDEIAQALALAANTSQADLTG
jgi:hypothetical protein